MAGDPTDRSKLYGLKELQGLKEQEQPSEPAKEQPSSRGGIKWQSDDAADSMLSDLLEDVNKDAQAEEEQLRAERVARDQRKKEEEAEQARQRAEGIQRRLEEEENRRAQAEQERQRLQGEAHRARNKPTEDSADEEASADQEQSGSESAAEAHAESPAPALQPAPVFTPAPGPPPEPTTSWGITVGIAIPLLIVALTLGALFSKEKAAHEQTRDTLTRAKSTNDGLEQELSGKTRKLDEIKARYDALQKEVDAQLAASAAAEEESAVANQGTTGKAAGKKRPAARRGAVKKKKKRKKSSKSGFDVGGAILSGEGKIVF